MNKPKKTGLIMSTGLARAAWLGVKRETRRLLNPQPALNGFGKLVYRTKAVTAIWHKDQLAPVQIFQACPYGQPGDMLYLKETWATVRTFDHLPGSAIPPEAPLFWASSSAWESPERGRTRAARFMPAAAARRFYVLEEIGVQQLGKIRHADIMREGLQVEKLEDEDFPLYSERCRLLFSALWNRLHAAHPTLWFENSPWVWVLKFSGVTS